MKLANAKRGIFSLLMTFISFNTLYSQFPGCDDTFDGVNLCPYSGGEYDFVFDPTLPPIQLGLNDPIDCWKSIFNYSNILLTNQGYSHLDDVFGKIKNISSVFAQPEQNGALAQIETGGRYGPLLNNLQAGQEYVASVMGRIDGSMFTDQSDVIGIHWLFDNHDLNILSDLLTNDPANNPVVEVNPNGIPFLEGSNTWLSSPPNNQVIPSYLPTTEVSGQFEINPGWHELNQSFVADANYANFLICGGSNSSIPLNGNSNSTYYTDIDDICVMPVSDNPISVRFIDPSTSELTHKQEFTATCGESTAIIMRINRSFVGNTNGNIVLELNVDGPTNVAFEDLGTPFNFGPNGMLTIPAGQISDFGFTAIAQFTPTFNAVGHSIISVEVHSSSPSGYICHSPTYKVNYPPASCKGDFDGNGLITASDLSDFLTLWGTSVTDCYSLSADFDGDSLITSDDLSAMLVAFGTICD